MPRIGSQSASIQPESIQAALETGAAPASPEVASLMTVSLMTASPQPEPPRIPRRPPRLREWSHEEVPEVLPGSA